jgi:hypothetical protein
MKHLSVAMLAALILLAGCVKPDKDRVDQSLRNNPFFRALGAVPGQSGSYTGHGGSFDGDTSWPIGAARAIHDPDVNYDINVSRPFADVDFQIAWPCTLMVVYTDIPDTSARDTVIKPAPKINGKMAWRFEFQGDSWKFSELSPCEAKFDSVLNHIRIDSLQVKARRAGQPLSFPTLANPATRLPVDSYPYTFRAGDSVDLKLWETNDLGSSALVWAFLHSDPANFTSGFQYDTLAHSFYGTWIVNQVGNHWVWFEVVDLRGAILSKTDPDRSILWGLPYVVE